MLQTTDSKNTGAASGLARLCRQSRFVMIALMLVMALAGCQKTEQGRLIGIWAMAKPDKLVQRVSTIPAASPAVEATGPGGEIAMMSLQFRSSGVLETVTKLGKIDSRKTGRWRAITRAADDPQTITEIECAIDSIVSQHKIDWIDDATIRINPPNMSGQKMILKFTRSDGLF